MTAQVASRTENETGSLQAEPISPPIIPRPGAYYVCSLGDEWKIMMIKELLEFGNQRVLDVFTTEEIQSVINYQS